MLGGNVGRIVKCVVWDDFISAWRWVKVGLCVCGGGGFLNYNHHGVSLGRTLTYSTTSRDVLQVKVSLIKPCILS